MFRKALRVTVAIGLTALAIAARATAQESSSRPDAATSTIAPAVPPPDAPSGALRDLLAAACAHDQTNFTKFLTARNLESFNHLAPTARTELMKRFVLLDGAGKPTFTASGSGRPVVRCATSE